MQLFTVESQQKKNKGQIRYHAWVKGWDQTHLVFSHPDGGLVMPEVLLWTEPAEGALFEGIP